MKIINMKCDSAITCINSICFHITLSTFHSVFISTMVWRILVFLFEMNTPEHLSDTPAFILLAWACSTSAPRSYISISFWQLFCPLLIVLTLGNCGSQLHSRSKRLGRPACSTKVHGDNRFCNRCRCEMCPKPRTPFYGAAGWRWCKACGRLGGPYFSIIHAILLGTVHGLVTWQSTCQHTFIDMCSCV